MGNEAGLIIRISGEAADFEKEIDKIKGVTKSLEDQLGAVAKTSGIAFAALAAAGGIAVHAFGESEKASKELTLTLQNQGIASQKLIEDYDALAKAIQKKTGVDDDAVTSGLAVLQNFVGQREISAELAGAMVDLAEKTGSIESAAQALGRGINGNTRVLKQFGIEVKESATKEERLAQITEQVTQKFGGLAETNGKGVGSLRGLTTAFGNFLEGVGKRLAPTLERAALLATEFFQTLADNGPLLTVITEVGKLAAVILGLVAAGATAAIAIVKIRDAILIAEAAMKILGLSTRALVGATGIGLILIIAAEIALNWGTIWPFLTKTYQVFVDSVSALSSALGKLLLGVINFNPAKIKEGLDEAKAVIAKGYAEIAGQQAPSVGVEQDAGKRAAAKAAAEEAIADEQRKQAVFQAEREADLLSAQQASEQMIALKKQEVELLKQIENDKNAAIRGLLEEQLEQNQARQEEQVAADAERHRVFLEEFLAQDANFQKLSTEQQEAFLQKNGKTLTDALLSEKQAEEKSHVDRVKKKIEFYNKLKEEGAAFAGFQTALQDAMNSREVQGFKKGTSELLPLVNSKNATLKSIGKAAAVADITMKTAQSAMNAFEGFSKIPIVGIPLGFAAAAAVVAFGVEQVGNVLSAQSGGVVPGFNAGGDSIPSILQAGEFVVPRQSFEETVSAVADTRAQQSTQASSGVATPGAGGAGQGVDVRLQFSGDGAEKFLTARRVEARSLGTLREAQTA